jgi:peptide/nickel transport system substrate-binding protein
MKTHAAKMLTMLTIFAALALAACGAPATPTAEAPAPTEAPAAQESGVAEDTATPEEAPPMEEGPTIVVAMRETGNSLDGRTGTWIMSEIVSTLFDTIVTIDENGDFQPGLAESWEVSDDGLRTTFHLQQGVKFHDGTDFNAEALRDWWKGFLGGPSSYVAEPIVEYDIADPYTITLVSETPYPNLLFNLSNYYAGVQSPTATEEYGEDYGTTYAVGTGPYKLVEFVKDDHVTVERNPDYVWGPSWLPYRGPANPQQIIFKALPEDAVRINEVMAGSAQIGLDITPQFVSQLESNPELVVHPFDKMGAVFLGFNFEKGPWQDLKVRQAVAQAIDKQAVVDNLWFGYADPTYEMLTPLFAESEGVAEAVGLGYDPEAAKGLLAEAGWSDSDGDGIVEKDGQPLTATLVSTTQTEYVRLAQAIQADLKDIGIAVDIQNFTDMQPPVEAGEFDLALQEWWWQNADIMDWWFNPAWIPYPNFSRWSEAETQQMFDAALTEPLNWEQRVQAYRDVNMHLTENVVAVPILAPKNVQVTNQSVENWMWITYGPQQWVMTDLKQ